MCSVRRDRRIFETSPNLLILWFDKLKNVTGKAFLISPVECLPIQKLKPPSQITDSSSSNFPLKQPLEEIKAVAITLQFPKPARRPILPSQLLHSQQSPIARYALDSRTSATFLLQRDDLVCMQPKLIVSLFQRFIEARAAEAVVDRFEGGENSRKQDLELEWRRAGWEEGVQGAGWCGVGDV